MARPPRGRPVASDAQAVLAGLDELFLETPFVGKLIALLERTRAERDYRLIGAAPGSGKTRVGTYYLSLNPARTVDGRTVRPVMRILTPNERRRQGAGIRERLADQIGAVVARKVQYSAVWIARRLEKLQTELLIVGDAHRMTPDEHLPAIQEITDLHEEFSGGRRMGVAFLSSTTRGSNLLQSQIELGDSAEWAQIRRRFSPLDGYVFLSGLSAADIRLILHAYDAELAERLPGLRLVRWTSAINDYLMRPRLSPEGRSHVPMGSLCRFVSLTVKLLVERGLTDIDPRGELIAEVGQSLLAGRLVKPSAASTDDEDERRVAATGQGSR